MISQLRLLVLMPLLVLGITNITAASVEQANAQNDLLAEYEQRLTLVEKQFAEFKKQLDPKKMESMEIKMQVGKFENSRNSLKSKLRDLRKGGAPLSETDRADLDKRFTQLTTDFEQVKKVTQ
ncbi:MAG: hypothetical protein M3Q95_00700 [Bacteroidota bacterium]|nr:hypothetical protein [Bacteroidota bacterium]